MEIIVTGLNHRHAKVDLREKLAVDPAALPAALAGLRPTLDASEMVVLSTCNRVEIYSVHEGEVPPPARIAALLAERRQVSVAELEPALYRHQGTDAVRHLFRVASSLDSMVLGETQIIGQVRDAYLACREAGATGRVFNRLFQQALHLAKRVHATTSIGEKSVSVPSVAARLAEKIFHELASKRLVIVGAGETAELAAAAFHLRGVRSIHVVNRSIENARALADRFGGHAHSLEELREILPLGDIVMTCIRSDDPWLGPEQVAAALATRRQEPMFLVDIGVPRNVRPEVNEIENVYLYNVDHLESIVQQNKLDREREVERCAPLVEEETQAFLQEVTPPDVTALLTLLRGRMHAIGEEELRRTLGKLNGLSADQREEVGELARRIVNKILHSPTETLRGAGEEARSPGISELVRKLFGLNK